MKDGNRDYVVHKGCDPRTNFWWKPKCGTEVGFTRQRWDNVTCKRCLKMRKKKSVNFLDEVHRFCTR